jgi:hypothetical protein
MKSSDWILIGVAVAVVAMFVIVAVISIYAPAPQPTATAAPERTPAPVKNDEPAPPKTGPSKPVEGNEPAENEIILDDTPPDPGETGWVSGCVTDESGKPVTWARVMVVFPQNIPPNRNHNFTGKDGGYKITLLPPNANYELECWKEGYAVSGKSGVEIRVGVETKSVDFVLEKGNEAVVKVVDGAGGSTIEGAQVRMTGSDPNLYRKSRFPPEQQTDKTGAVRFKDVAAGEYTVIARHPAYISTNEQFRLIVEEGKPAELTVTLSLGGRITGRAIDESGNPVEDVSVWVTASDPRPDPGRDAIITAGFKMGKSGKDGMFVIEGIPSGDFQLEARKNGYLQPEKENVAVAAGGEVKDLIITLPSGQTISGRVVDADGNPVRDANVMASFNTCFSQQNTDEKGEFTLSGLVDGRFRVAASARDFLAESKENVPSGTRDLVLILSKASEVSGAVLADSPVQNFIIKLLEDDPGSPTGKVVRRQQYFRYGDSGEFTMRFVRPGRYIIMATSQDFEDGPGVPLEVRSNDSIPGLRLRLGPRK